MDLKLENVTIESVAAEGKAVARVDGMVVFVDFAVPGDVVDIQVHSFPAHLDPSVFYSTNLVKFAGNENLCIFVSANHNIKVRHDT